ncbi:ABC transporter ATP-binding protein [Salinibacterium hongtaonis]|uniref:ABC transporter ATP-binding protein n=1 Tax=Homoserinimonas hongtaonis TaxID=2079791 RepID=UPI000D35569F|nr:ATP-binding cassette domain-containing protein [Salinibacterium hongtaonis]AWB88975.1 ABC transporter [Salinibacterium hongtaonis]
MLCVEGVSFCYSTGNPVIVDLNARFDPGEVVAVTGASGRGKSTLLYLLGLMLRPTAGSVLLDGREVSRLSDSARATLRAERFGFVFQDAALDPTRTVLDNVVETALYAGMSRNEALAKAEHLLSRFGVSVRALAKPGQVSGGQAQRIALCRALLNSPDVLLADEPTGNLDPLSADLVIGAFHEHARSGNVVIVVTHDPVLVSRCTRRVEL